MHGGSVSDESGPGHVDYWPEHPSGAQYHHDEPFIFGFVGHGWSVDGVPPGFPFADSYLDRARYGPPGTQWVFSEADMFASFAGLPAQPTRAAINYGLRKFGYVLGGGTQLAFVTPDPGLQPPRGTPMRWIHATIVAKLGATEQVAHTLNFRTAPAADVDQTPAQLTTFAGQIRDQWVAFMTRVAGANTVQRYMSPDLVYTEVRAAYLEQTVPASIATHVSHKTGRPVKDFTYPKPTYLVPTQYATFGPTQAVGNSTDPTLPYEVAGVLSLTTGLRGPRYRGRLYLGGLSQTIMGANGLFQASAAQGLATAFQAGFVTPLNTNTGNRLHIVSRAYDTSAGVNGVRMGVVPDSQRRRRKKQNEAYGAVVPT